MTTKRISQSIVVIAILVASLASAGGAMAWSGCASSTTVQSGDSLIDIAMACGTTAEAIRAANPGLGSSLYPGQVLNIPGGSSSASAAYVQPQTNGGTYVVQWGDTLGDIAARYGVPMNALMAVNPQIWNASMIFPGQVINLPGSGGSAGPMYYPPTYNPPTYNPPTYNQPTYYPPAYNPPAYNPPTYYPPTSQPPAYTQFRRLRVTYGHGLVVRTGPARSYTEIAGPLVSAVNGSTWLYRKGSATVDPEGFVWVEVALSQPVNGYSTGWIVVKDGLGNYYTRPPIDP